MPMSGISLEMYQFPPDQTPFCCRIYLGSSLAGDEARWTFPDSETDPKVRQHPSIPAQNIPAFPSWRTIQRCRCCRMTLISTALPPEALTQEWTKLGPDASLTLSAPGKEPLQVSSYHPEDGNLVYNSSHPCPRGCHQACHSQASQPGTQLDRQKRAV